MNDPFAQNYMITNTQLFSLLANNECPENTLHLGLPIVLCKGQKSTLWDVEGQAYTDLCAGFGSLPLGHNDPAVTNSLMEALQQNTIHQALGDIYPGQHKVVYLKNILNIMPQHLTRAVFTVTGAQAVDYALKTIYLLNRGNHIITFNEGYHGLDSGALTVTSWPIFKSKLPQLTAITTSQLSFGCTKEQLVTHLEKLRLKGVKPAAIITEPIQGRAGVVIPPHEWLLMLKEVCSEYKILLVIDDIFTGLGRTGRLTHADISMCDLLLLGKALGGGMPLACCLGRDNIMAVWRQNLPFGLYTGTFFGHNLACLVGNTTVELIVKRQLVARSDSLGQQARNFLSAQLEHDKKVVAVRGQGLMLGIELTCAYTCKQVLLEALTHGVIAIPSGLKGNVISLSPALDIPKDLFFNALTILINAIRKQR